MNSLAEKCTSVDSVLRNLYEACIACINGTNRIMKRRVPAKRITTTDHKNRAEWLARRDGTAGTVAGGGGGSSDGAACRDIQLGVRVSKIGKN